MITCVSVRVHACVLTQPVIDNMNMSKEFWRTADSSLMAVTADEEMKGEEWVTAYALAEGQYKTMDDRSQGTESNPVPSV
jgi:hypothetical protein